MIWHPQLFLHRTDWQTGRVLGDLFLFLFALLQMMLDTLVEILVLLPGLNHVDPLFPQLVDSVEDVDLRGWTGVDVVYDLVHTDECSSPTHPGTAVDQERSSRGLGSSLSASLSVE